MAENSTANTSSLSDGAQLEIQVLQLREELEKAASENKLAAQYGLQILEEKQHLELKLQDVELMYENARAELDGLKEVGRVLNYFC